MAFGNTPDPLPIAARRLATAVRRFLTMPNEGNRQTMRESLEFFEEQTR